MAMIFHTSRAARSSPDTPANPILNAPIFSTNKPPRIRHQTRTNKITNVSNFLTFRDRWKDKAKANRRKSILNLKYKLHILKLTGDDEDEKYDILSTLDEYVMENILRYLNFVDLLSLSKTSNAMLCKVQSFALHYVESHLRMERLDKFFSCRLLTYEERIIKNRIERESGPQLSTSLMVLKYLNQYGQFFDRASITTAWVANRKSQLYKQRYIVRELCEPLGRDVLRLKQICGLRFEKQFNHIPAGNYQVSIHLHIGVDLERSGRPRKYNNNCTSILTVMNMPSWNLTSILSGPMNYGSLQDDDDTLVSVNIEPHYWKLIQRNKFDNDLLDGNAWITREENMFPYHTNDWFYVTLKPFQLTNDDNHVVFYWSERESNSWTNSGRWKEGMSWDFVQIQGVS